MIICGYLADFFFNDALRGLMIESLNGTLSSIPSLVESLSGLLSLYSLNLVQLRRWSLKCWFASIPPSPFQRWEMPSILMIARRTSRRPDSLTRLFLLWPHQIREWTTSQHYYRRGSVRAHRWPMKSECESHRRKYRLVSFTIGE